MMTAVGVVAPGTSCFALRTRIGADIGGTHVRQSFVKSDRRRFHIVAALKLDTATDVKVELDFLDSAMLGVLGPANETIEDIFADPALDDHLFQAPKKRFGRPSRKRTNIFQALAALAFDSIEHTFIRKLETGYPLRSSADPRIQLKGNFAPVSETAVHHKLRVVGVLPQVLDGVYLRNGANPRFKPSAGHHFFDGDGMIHSVRFKNGIANYCCRYTRTYRLEEEEKEGRAFFPKAIGELHGFAGVGRILLYFARGAVGLLNLMQGFGVANAGLVFHHGRLLAMSEDDLPYAIHVKEDGDLYTEERYDFNGKLKHSMIAHPKIDPDTGELFSLSYNVLLPPYLKFFRVSPSGVKHEDVIIRTSGQPTLMHDFAITKNFAVIPDQQVTFNMTEMMKDGSPVSFNPNKKSRFGLLPKYDSNDNRLQWIEVPDCFCFHLWNAWEEGDEVVILGSSMSPPDSIFNDNAQEVSPLTSVLSEIRLNSKSGGSTRRTLIPNLNLEAGQLNRTRIGKRNRYLYMAVAEPLPLVAGIAKVDLQSESVEVYKFAEGCYGGEPIFIPRTANPDDDTPEDDGYVLTFLHNEKTGQSELLVLDGSTPSLTLMASIKMPCRVPYGLHGTYVSSQDLATQPYLHHS